MVKWRGTFCVQRLGACVAMLVVTCNGSDGQPGAGAKPEDRGAHRQPTTQSGAASPVVQRGVDAVQLAEATNTNKGIGVGPGPEKQRPDPPAPRPAARPARGGGTMASMVRELLDGVDPDKPGEKINLTVFPFVSGAGREARVTRLGVELSRALERSLVKDRALRRLVRVFARRRVKRMLEAAGSSEFVSPEAARRTGQSLGAQLVVWGTVIRVEQGYQVALELRRVQEDEMVSAADTVLPAVRDYDRWYDESIRPKKLTLSALLDTASWELSRRLVDQFKPVRAPVKVAVLELEGPEPKQVGPIGRSLADRMENDLAELAKGTMELYQRSMLNRILKQRGFEMYGPGFQKEVGDLLTTQQVGVFVLGRITAEGTGQGATYALNVRLIDCKTSRILATARTSMARPAGESAPTRIDVLCFRLFENTRGTVTPGARLRTNDGVKVRIRSGRPLHVWAFLVDGPKRVLCLYPGGWVQSPTNPVPAGTGEIPSGGDTYFWLVRSREGASPKKTLIVAASPTGKPGLDQLVNKARRGEGARTPVLDLSANDIRQAIQTCEITRAVDFVVEGR